MNIEKEEQIFIRHMAELSKQAYHKGISVFSDFLSLNEQSLFYGALKEFPQVPYSVYGGVSGAERVVVCFHGDISDVKLSSPDISDTQYFDKDAFPIDCIKVSPLNAKFADKLTHRDYLGAILNLGIERALIGDILIEDDNGYIFCLSSITDFITGSLEKIKHTNVKTEIVPPGGLSIKREFKQVSGTVSSIRLDSIIALGFNTSRNGILPYISAGKVFVNGRETTSNSYVLKEGDVISVRGLGKIIYDSQGGLTKKGRLGVKLLKYI